MGGMIVYVQALNKWFSRLLRGGPRKSVSAISGRQAWLPREEYMKIESVSYKHGMLKKLSHKKRLRPAYFTGDEIPDEVETIIEKGVSIV